MSSKPDYAELERLVSTEFTSQLALDDAERSIIRATAAILADVRRMEAATASLREQLAVARGEMDVARTENAALREQLSKVQSELKNIQSYLRENDE